MDTRADATSVPQGRPVGAKNMEGEDTTSTRNDPLLDPKAPAPPPTTQNSPSHMAPGPQPRPYYATYITLLSFNALYAL